MSHFKSFAQERAYYKYKGSPYNAELLTPEVREVLEADKAKKELRRLEIEERKQKREEIRRMKEERDKMRKVEKEIAKMRHKKSSWSLR